MSHQPHDHTTKENLQLTVIERAVSGAADGAAATISNTGATLALWFEAQVVTP